MKHTLIALFALLLTVPAQAAQPVVELPFTSARALLLVHITVEGKQLTLILDTGAERTVINSPEGVERMQSVAIGNKLLRLSVAYAPMGGIGLDKVHADGVLGQDVLRRFKSMGIDYAAQKITLAVQP